ncbi:tRNA isopentenyltransferase, partial [Neolentinus lepideus HHB14362 ss-1]
MNARPLIAICGTTGVGKSKLSIELALALANSRGTQKHGWHGARIINADSMQVYTGMDIITNKVPESEQQGVEHLLMSFKNPGEQYVVGEWVSDAVREINETHAQHKIPIVVGGTSYWIQHLLFPDRLATTSRPSDRPAEHTQLPHEMAQYVSKLPPELQSLLHDLPEEPPDASVDSRSAFSLYNLLKDLDPAAASRWHWKDTRKVLRSLEIIKETGRKPSDIWNEQSGNVMKPRYRTLCFWLFAEPSALNPRLDARVDDMIKQGLLDEINSLQKIATAGYSPFTDSQYRLSSPSPVDYTLGIYQAIGYKEFHDYLNSSNPTEASFKEAIDRMKLSTRQYAQRQVKWIRNKLLPAVYATQVTDKSSITAYLLDASRVDATWNSNVRDKGEQIMHDFLEGNSLPDPFSLSEIARIMLTVQDRPTRPTARRKVICPVCTTKDNEPVMIEEGEQWEIHRKTRAHKYMATREARWAEVAKWKRIKEERKAREAESRAVQS